VTKGGYWLIKVLDKADDRELDSKDRDYLISQKLNEWVSTLWVNAGDNVVNYLDGDKKQWAIDRAMQG
jgi:predicted RNA-binding protein (virulence factor B family)